MGSLSLCLGFCLGFQGFEGARWTGSLLTLQSFLIFDLRDCSTFFLGGGGCLTCCATHLCTKGAKAPKCAECFSKSGPVSGKGNALHSASKGLLKTSSFSTEFLESISGPRRALIAGYNDAVHHYIIRDPAVNPLEIPPIDCGSLCVVRKINPPCRKEHIFSQPGSPSRGRKHPPIDEQNCKVWPNQ